MTLNIETVYSVTAPHRQLSVEHFGGKATIRNILTRREHVLLLGCSTVSELAGTVEDLLLDKEQITQALEQCIETFHQVRDELRESVSKLPCYDRKIEADVVKQVSVISEQSDKLKSIMAQIDQFDRFVAEGGIKDLR